MAGLFIFLGGSCMENSLPHVKNCVVGPEFGRLMFSAEMLLLL